MNLLGHVVHRSVKHFFGSVFYYYLPMTCTACAVGLNSLLCALLTYRYYNRHFLDYWSFRFYTFHFIFIFLLLSISLHYFSLDTLYGNISMPPGLFLGDPCHSVPGWVHRSPLLLWYLTGANSLAVVAMSVH